MSPLSPGCTSRALGTEDSQTCCKSVNLGIFTASPGLQSEVSAHRVMGRSGSGKHLPWATWPHHSPWLVCDELGSWEHPHPLLQRLCLISICLLQASPFYSQSRVCTHSPYESINKHTKCSVLEECDTVCPSPANTSPQCRADVPGGKEVLGVEVGWSCRSQGGQLRQQKSSPEGEADRSGEEEVEPKQRTQHVQRPRCKRERTVRKL